MISNANVTILRTSEKRVSCYTKWDLLVKSLKHSYFTGIKNHTRALVKISVVWWESLIILWVLKIIPVHWLRFVSFSGSL